MMQFNDKQKKYAEKLSKISKVEISEATVNAFAYMAEENLKAKKAKRECFKNKLNDKFKRLKKSKK